MSIVDVCKSYNAKVHAVWTYVTKCTYTESRWRKYFKRTYDLDSQLCAYSMQWILCCTWQSSIVMSIYGVKKKLKLNKIIIDIPKKSIITPQRWLWIICAHHLHFIIVCKNNALNSSFEAKNTMSTLGRHFEFWKVYPVFCFVDYTGKSVISNFRMMQ